MNNKNYSDEMLQEYIRSRGGGPSDSVNSKSWSNSGTLLRVLNSYQIYRYCM